MIGYDKNFEKQCGEYLDYLYHLVEKRYNDCSDIDALVQDTLTALIVKISLGESIEYPKGFLSAVLKNKYNTWLREKYKAGYVEYADGAISETYHEVEEKENAGCKTEEYEAVRREIGRLTCIYREVTVRHYVHGQTAEQIARELGIPRGTVLSRLSAARDQIKEGLENMEKYSHISYEPKTASIGIWGNAGLKGEPFSLMRSDIEANILNLAYENPVSVRGIADTMGMPSAYIEPIIDFLVEGELMGRTAGGLVYTRCFVQRYEDAFGDIPAQEKLADQYASRVWEIVWKHIEPLTKRNDFAEMSDKQKATMLLFVMNQLLSNILCKSRPDSGHSPKHPPDRPDAGRWLATVTVYAHNQMRDNPYGGSGPVYVGYSTNHDGTFDCQMFDCQSLFGDAHWAYSRFKYKCYNMYNGTEIIFGRIPMKENMGQIIKRLRKERNLTHEELAEQLNISAQAISKWENGTSMPDVSQVVPLANLFGVPTDVLFGVYGTEHEEEVHLRLKEIYEIYDGCKDGEEGATALLYLTNIEMRCEPIPTMQPFSPKHLRLVR